MKLIAFEGIDACGKETQAELLVDWLTDLGYKVLPMDFPRYHEPIGKIIRQWLDEKIDLTDESIHMLYEADRQDFMKIVNWLETINECDFIVLDRYTLSNLAFGKAKGIDLKWLRDLQAKVRKPDITFLLDISPHTSLKRREVGRDRHEQDLELLEGSRQAYVDIAHSQAKQGDIIFLLDGEQEPDKIHQQIKKIVSTLF